MTVSRRRTLWTMAAVFLSFGLPASSFAAQTAQSLVDHIKDAHTVSPGANLEVLMLGDETIVSVTGEATASEEEVRKQAAGIARALSAEEGARGKPLKILFADSTGNVRAVTLSAGQLASGGSLGSTSFAAGQKAWTRATEGTVATAASPAASSAAPSGAGFQGERNKLMSRIQALQAKGVGVQPYFAQVSQIDQIYSHGDLSQAQSIMAKLSDTVGEQEKVIKERQAQAAAKRASAVATAAAANPAAAANGKYTPAQLRMIQRMRTDGATDSQISDALANFSGTSDQYYDEIARTMLQHELGDLAPCEGPFRMNRFRIAKKIQDLRNHGTPVESYIAGFRRIEEMAAAANKDPRQVASVADNVRYMEQSLGLSELQGGSHRSH